MVERGLIDCSLGECENQAMPQRICPLTVVEKIQHKLDITNRQLDFHERQIEVEKENKSRLEKALALVKKNKELGVLIDVLGVL